MKHKICKKKIIILIVSFLVILLGFGTFKGYQSFRYDQYQTVDDMGRVQELFNMQLQVPDEEKPGGWIYLQPLQLPNDRYGSSFDTKTFFNYMLKKVTFQEIEYKDVEPQWSLLPTQANPKLPNPPRTAECLKNFNENLLYNPEYEQDKRDAEFNKPLTMDDLLHNTKKVAKLIYRLIDITEGDGSSLDELTKNPCPSQYLTK